jgi:hypothetical protein
MQVKLKALIGKLNDTTRAGLEGAAGLCLSRTHYDIEIEHLLLKLLDVDDCDFAFILRRFAVDRSRLHAELTRSLDKLKSGNQRNPAFSPTLLNACRIGWLHGSLDFEATKIRSGFIILALLGDPDLSRLVRDFSKEMQKIDADTLQNQFQDIVQGSVETGQTPTLAPETAIRQLTGVGVFICYRHEDSAFVAVSLADRLFARVPDVRVFRDTDTLQPGMIFSERIEKTLEDCDILLALIGKKWLKASHKGRGRKLDDPDDWVRLEIGTAIRQGKTVVPCLIGGATLPRRDELPLDIADLTLRHAVGISPASFERDTDALIDMLRSWQKSGPGAG